MNDCQPHLCEITPTSGERLRDGDNPLVTGRLGYQPQLDGLRTIAVAAVVAGHTGVKAFERGFLGVDIFFVLSGFLITSILVQEFDSTGTVSIRTFYARRARRLGPGLALVVLFTLIAFTVFHPLHAHDTLLGVPASALYISSWVRAFSLSPLGWLGHTWSLSVEETFYLLWPGLLLAMCRRSRPRITALIAICFIAAVIYRVGASLAGFSSAYMFNAPDMRAEQLLAGCLLSVLLIPRAVFRLTRVTRILLLVLGGIALMVFAILYLTPHGLLNVDASGAVSAARYSTGVSTVVAAAAAVLICVLVVLPGNWLSVVLGSRPFVWLGKRSYGIYLWHVPLFGLFYLQGEPNSIRYGVRLALIPATVLIAACSYRFVERPVLDRVRHGGMRVGGAPTVSSGGTRS